MKGGRVERPDTNDTRSQIPRGSRYLRRRPLVYDVNPGTGLLDSKGFTEPLVFISLEILLYWNNKNGVESDGKIIILISSDRKRKVDRI